MIKTCKFNRYFIFHILIVSVNSFICLILGALLNEVVRWGRDFSMSYHSGDILSFVVFGGFIILATYLPWNIGLLLLIYKLNLCPSILNSIGVVCIESLGFGIIAMQLETFAKYPILDLVLTDLFILIVVVLIRWLSISSRVQKHISNQYTLDTKFNGEYKYIFSKRADEGLIYIIVLMGMSIVFLL